MKKIVVIKDACNRSIINEREIKQNRVKTCIVGKEEMK